MDEDARAVAQRFASLKRPNASFPVRHRIIDDMLRRELEEDRGRRVAVIGSGFDSRPFRLEGGRWVELDEPALLRRKEARLPVSEAPNELVRVPIRFAEDSLDEKLRPFATDDGAIVVLEGVIGYLGDPQRRALLTTLGRLFPRHRLICDLLTRTFLRRYGRKFVRILGGLGVSFAVVRRRARGAVRRARLRRARARLGGPASRRAGRPRRSAGIRSSPAAKPARGLPGLALRPRGRETGLVVPTAPL